jgi:propionate CoA-transferase
MEGEVIVGEVLALAQAAHNSGGVVIAQVARLETSSIPPHRVRVPGILVDRIVVASPEDHGQTFREVFNPAYTSARFGNEVAQVETLPLDERRIIAGRACDEIPEGAIANLGIGMPEGIARIAGERGWFDRFTLTIESGPIGGMPAGGLSFGASEYPDAIVDQPAQFDLYDGRALDFAALGAAQIDGDGNVNVSRFGDKMAGIGGFANITQTARKLVFCSTFTAGGLEIEIRDGRLFILREGKARKFLAKVEQCSFSARRSRLIGQEVLYVTERAVFRLGAEGIELIELAPGIDLERDVLAQMDFTPIVRKVRTMSPDLFRHV